MLYLAAEEVPTPAELVGQLITLAALCVVAVIMWRIDRADAKRYGRKAPSRDD